MLGTIRYAIHVSNDGRNWHEYDDQSVSLVEALALAAELDSEQSWRVEVAITVASSIKEGDS